MSQEKTSRDRVVFRYHLRVWGHPNIEVLRFAYAAPLPHPETFSAADYE